MYLYIYTYIVYICVYIIIFTYTPYSIPEVGISKELHGAKCRFSEATVGGVVLFRMNLRVQNIESLECLDGPPANKHGRVLLPKGR